MDAVPKFLSGVFVFEGRGLDAPVPLAGGLRYVVPRDRRSQLVFLRAGNSADALICVTLMRDNTPMRLFPIGAKAAAHVPLTVTEDLEPDTALEVCVAAPGGVTGHVVLDVGLVEI